MHSSQQPSANSNHQQSNAAASSVATSKRLSDVEDGGGRSDDWCSETSSSNFGQLRQPIAKGRAAITSNRHRKYTINPSITTTTTAAATTTTTENGPMKQASSDVNHVDDASKKPLIAIWKAGVKLQNASTLTQSQTENNGL